MKVNMIDQLVCHPAVVLQDIEMLRPAGNSQLLGDGLDKSYNG